MSERDNDPAVDLIYLVLWLFAWPPMLIWCCNTVFRAEIEWTFWNWWSCIVLGFAIRIITVKTGRDKP